MKDIVVPHDVTFAGSEIFVDVNKDCGGTLTLHHLCNPAAPPTASPSVKCALPAATTPLVRPAPHPTTPAHLA